MSYNEVTKNPSRFRREEIINRKITRGHFPSTAKKRGDIAKDITGDVSAKITRRDIEEKYGTKAENSFGEVTKNDSDWSEV